MERHLRHKFACEIFIGIDGFPPDIMAFPNIDKINAWKILYLPKDAQELDYWYILDLANWSLRWKQLECFPFHIPKKESLQECLKRTTELTQQREAEQRRLEKLSTITGKQYCVPVRGDTK